MASTRVANVRAAVFRSSGGGAKWERSGLPLATGSSGPAAPAFVLPGITSGTTGHTWDNPALAADVRFGAGCSQSYRTVDPGQDKPPGVRGLITAIGWAERPGVHMNPALPPLPRFPKRFEAHAIGWKGEFYA
jgi:hypothetical protein